MSLMLQLCFSLELEVRDPDYYQGFQLPILPPAFLKGPIEREVMIKSPWNRQRVIEAVPGASRLNLPPRNHSQAQQATGLAHISGSKMGSGVWGKGTSEV